MVLHIWIVVGSKRVSVRDVVHIWSGRKGHFAVLHRISRLEALPTERLHPLTHTIAPFHMGFQIWVCSVPVRQSPCPSPGVADMDQSDNSVKVNAADKCMGG